MDAHESVAADRDTAAVVAASVGMALRWQHRHRVPLPMDAAK